MNRTLHSLVGVAALMFAALGGRSLRAQAMPTATGAGSYVAVGGGLSSFRSNYDSRYLGGTMLFVDLQPEWHFGFEAEARFLRYNTDEGVDQTNYLFGIRTAVNPHLIRPYAKFLAGTTEIHAPFGYGTGTFFTMVPGVGIDVAIADRINIRPLDVEYQVTPDFIGSNVRNVGISAGLSIRINGLNRLPNGDRVTGRRVKHYRDNGPYFGPQN